MSLVGIILTLSACGQGLIGASAPPEQSRVIAGESLLLDLYEQVMGSVEDRRAQAFLVHADMQGSLARCMATSGHDYNVPPFYDAYAGQRHVPMPDTFPQLPRASVAHAETHGFGVADGLVASRQTAVDAASEARFRARTTAYEALSPAERNAYDERLTQCSAALPPGLEEPPSPAGQGSLHEQLIAVWEDAVSSAAVRSASAGYVECMQREGMEVEAFEGRQSLLGQVHSTFAPFMPDSDGSVELEVADPAFAQARAFERAAAVADARCRSDAHALAMDELLPQLRAFAHEHAEELASLRGEWAEIRSEAERARAEWNW